MKRASSVQAKSKAGSIAWLRHAGRARRWGALAVFGFAATAGAQAITIDTSGNATTGQISMVDRRYQQIHPTQLVLSDTALDPKTRHELIRFLISDQGFAMRPFPKGHKGLTLAANGKMDPAGEAYLSMVTSEGISANPGDRLVITDVKIEKSRIVLMLNGGPDAKHRFLSHIQLGTGASMGPVVPTDPQNPTGSRLTLTFKDRIPEVTGKQVEALLAPLISFEVKTPIQAFTDTLPPKLKEAILGHNVLVGMSTDMVLFAKGQPQSKIREMDGQMPFEEWIYGKPPQDVEFVRINGNRVIRVEIAKIGKPPLVFTKNEVEGMMRTDGTALTADNVHTVREGDVQRDPNTQAPAAPPSLRGAGEAAPDNGPTSNDRVGRMKPVQFPKQAPDDHPVAHQGEQKPAAQPDSQGQGSQSKPPDNAQPQTAQPQTIQPQPPDASQAEPAKPPQGGDGGTQPQ